jgi:type II secretory pathway pseudopilin PulG
MNRSEKMKQRKSKGFSITEVIVAFGVVLVVAAIAAPTVVRSLRSYRVGSTGTDVSNLIQRTRYEAIKQNRVVTLRTRPQGNLTQLWIDIANPGVVDATEPFILLPPDVALLPNGVAPSTGSMNLGATTVMDATNLRMSFDSRGAVDYGGAPATTLVVCVGMPNDPSYGYRAVSVTPLGKMKIWRAESQTARWK